MAVTPSRHSPRWTIHEHSALHTSGRAAVAAVLLGLVLWVPTWGFDKIGVVNDALIVVVAAASLNLLFGYAGQLSMGHSAFFGIGSYTTAVLVKEYGVPPGWTFCAGAAIAFVFGVAVAVPALRIRGIYLGLVTLGVAFLFPRLVGWRKLEWLTGGQTGLDNVKYAPRRAVDSLPNWPLVGRFWDADRPGPQDRAAFHFFLSLLVLVVSYSVIRGIVRSRIGRSLIAIRDNESAAAMMGVNVARTKTMVFGISAAICALAGSLATLRSGVVTPSSQYIAPIGSVVLFVAVVIGGASTLWGPIVGGFVYSLLRYWMPDITEQQPFRWLFGWSSVSPAGIVFAVLLVVVVFAAPNGLVGLLRTWVARLVLVRPGDPRRDA